MSYILLKSVRASEENSQSRHKGLTSIGVWSSAMSMIVNNLKVSDNKEGKKTHDIVYLGEIFILFVMVR